MARNLVLGILLVATAARADEPKVADQELGARVGASLNLGGTSPGGLYLAGTWLYRLTDVLWFDGRAGFAIGSGDATCSFPASGSGGCGSKVASGFGVEALAGVRWFVPTEGRFAPYIGGGLGIVIANFSGDDLTGVGIPLWFAGGVRTRVSDTISVGGEADLGFGPVHYGRSVGWDSFLDVKLIVGVDFAL